MATGASFEKPSISLLSILKALKRSITEDEAWAIAYQAVVTAEECYEKSTLFKAVEEPSQLWLNCGGDVDAKSFSAILCDNPDGNSTEQHTTVFYTATLICYVFRFF